VRYCISEYGNYTLHPTTSTEEEEKVNKGEVDNEGEDEDNDRERIAIIKDREAKIATETGKP
jgi:hypothetical protein